MKNDYLDLRVPVWITDMKFNSNDKIITCTRHHQVSISSDLMFENTKVCINVLSIIKLTFEK